MQIVNAESKDLECIRNIATIAWDKTYKEILSPEQSEYMLEMMYSDKSLKNQIQQDNLRFILIRKDESEDYKGFASIEYHYNGANKTKIHKLYVLPNTQGAGYGRILIDHIASLASKEGDTDLTLNMNRFNKSYGFYTKMGFAIVGEEDINIGNGYIMEDYIFEKNI